MELIKIPLALMVKKIGGITLPEVIRKENFFIHSPTFLLGVALRVQPGAIGSIKIDPQTKRQSGIVSYTSTQLDLSVSEDFGPQDGVKLRYRVIDSHSKPVASGVAAIASLEKGGGLAYLVHELSQLLKNEAPKLH